MSLATLPLSVVIALLTILVVVRKRFVQDGSATTHIPGCRRFGLLDRSNMSDQYSETHRGLDQGDIGCKVKALFVYPIKSCGRIEVSESDIVATGLRYDRQFCFAQLISEEQKKEPDDLSVNTSWTHTWKFITQRRHPKLSQVQTEIWLPDPSTPDYSPELEYVKTKGCIVCRFPFTPDTTITNFWTTLKAKLTSANFNSEPCVTFTLPIAPGPDRCTKYSREVMNIWKDFPEAINVSSELPTDTLAKLKYFLGVSNPIALFMADPMKRRDVFRNAPTKDEAGYQPGTGFADAYPLSIMGLASVQKVSNDLPASKARDLSALRFRANIYVTGPKAFAEDDWKKIRIGSLVCHVSCRTTRCQLPNVDPETGIADRQEPYLTLKRTRGNVDAGAGPNPCLGMQMVPLLKQETDSEEIKVGDDVEILETGEHFYVRMFPLES